MLINRVKGTQDIIADIDLYNFIIDNIKKHLDLYNFKEIKVPVLEYLELFQRSVGEFTDIINKELYIVNPKNVDNQDEKICLRPEFTAGIVRAFLNNKIDYIPWKVFTYGPLFRHERPQKGRLREFNQVSIEVIATDSIYQDINLIRMLERLFLDRFDIHEYALLINFLGCFKDRALYKDFIKKFLYKNNKLCSSCNIRRENNILRVFDCKNEICQNEYINIQPIIDFLCNECVNEWQTLQNGLEALSVSYSYNKNLVRGLDYYDKVVFEFVSSLNLGSQNTFCAGGRYNRLAKEIGAKNDYPSIGAAIGIERLMMMLNNNFKISNSNVVVIIPIDRDQNELALIISDLLHNNNIKNDIVDYNLSIKNKFKFADKSKAKFAVIIGENEISTNSVLLKDMQSSSKNNEILIKQNELVQFLKSHHYN